MLGFELVTFRTRVSSRNQETPALLHMLSFILKMSDHLVTNTHYKISQINSFDDPVAASSDLVCYLILVATKKFNSHSHYQFVLILLWKPEERIIVSCEFLRDSQKNNQRVVRRKKGKKLNDS